ncbi:MAG: single-stranded DNA-binding protein [Cyanobacteria bacterium P01_H01_bin.105]
MMNQPNKRTHTITTNNTVILIGNLGEDPKTHVKNGNIFVRLSLATTDRYKDAETGAWMSRKPIWHTVFINSKTVQEYALRFQKGDRIKITGSLSYRKRTVSAKGYAQTFTEASIAASRIEDASLSRSPKAENNAPSQNSTTG